jgi:hypothetical protein
MPQSRTSCGAATGPISISALRGALMLLKNIFAGVGVALLGALTLASAARG